MPISTITSSSISSLSPITSLKTSSRSPTDIRISSSKSPPPTTLTSTSQSGSTTTSSDTTTLNSRSTTSGSSQPLLTTAPSSGVSSTTHGGLISSTSGTAERESTSSVADSTISTTSAGAHIAPSGRGPSGSSSPHHVSEALVIALPIIPVAFSVAAALYYYKARKRRRLANLDVKPATRVNDPSIPPPALTQHSAQSSNSDAKRESRVVDDHGSRFFDPEPRLPVPPQSVISSRSSLRRVSTQDHSAHAPQNGSTSSRVFAFPYDPDPHHRTSTFPMPPPATARTSPDVHHSPERDLRQRRSHPRNPPAPPPYDALIAAAELDSREPAVAPEPSSQAPALSSTPPVSAFETRVVIENQLSTAGRNEQDGAIVLPWPLGEQLLSFLANAPSRSRREEEGSTNVGSETLPAYAPRE
ncbi:hypothetical protein TRAPUB_5663 [Trametes pubescens]|uniref:Uncharacterized protein n=1 Tax=Trametes pubescens TaxID=154538 RepID=A0A1M2V7T5_TRAPU|nr:hypothetical protein TRAPUB_5663 [Trametes pubescens]